MKDFFETVFGAIAGPFFLVVGLTVMYVVAIQLGINLQPMFALIVALTPIWLPVTLYYLLHERWMEFVHAKFRFFTGRTTLRIKLPQEVLKSPEAMESVLTQIHNPNAPDNLVQSYWDGKHPLVSSLELVSYGGDIRFYANVPRAKTKNALEAQLYAQYPGVEVVEESIDYAAEVVWDPKKWDVMSFHLCKKGEDVVPIKTYIDYGLDKQPKEELKFEPMAPILEHLGKAKPHERLWIQILMVPHAKQDFKTGSIKAQDTWEKTAQAKVNAVMGRGPKKMGKEESEDRPVLTGVERDMVSAIQRNVSKYAYEVAIRAMYITPPDRFDGEMIGPMLKSFAQYDMMGRNGIGVRWRTDFDYNFISDRSGAKKLAMKKRELEAYKKRHYYHEDKKGKADVPKIMSVEELATIFHLPGTSVVTPNLARVENTRKEAPANLPTGEWNS
jgi:hypothetical protein